VTEAGKRRRYGGEQISSGDVQEIARKHGIRDTPDFFLPRLAVIAAVLASDWSTAIRKDGVKLRRAFQNLQ